jgi:hypothetical protein
VHLAGQRICNRSVIREKSTYDIQGTNLRQAH